MLALDQTGLFKGSFPSGRSFRHLRAYFPIALVMVLFAACDASERKLPASAGADGEVIVVMPDGHWGSTPGEAVRELLNRPIEGLPQREPHFKVVNTTPEAFGDLVAAHHSVLFAVIGNEADTNAIQLMKDRNARDQLFVRIAAEGPSEWVRLLREQGDQLLHRFETHQRQRIIKRLRNQRDAEVIGKIEEAHGISIEVPAGFRMAKQEEGSSWLQRDRMMSGSGLEHNVIEGILVYHYPYMNDSTFNIENLVNVRDSVTRSLVPGPVDGSYMIVQRGFGDLDLMPGAIATEADGRFAFFMRGLFGMEGAKMGGPFSSLTVIDEERGRVVTVEGFVYAPQFDKRAYMRELEAILFSLRIGPGKNR